jgi:lipopolysaccharide/colanic/teichoic acid biosynthesis glycosyltransferase
MSSTNEEAKAVLAQLKEILQQALAILDGNASPVEPRPAAPETKKGTRKNADV